MGQFGWRADRERIALRAIRRRCHTLTQRFVPTVKDFARDRAPVQTSAQRWMLVDVVTGLQIGFLHRRGTADNKASVPRNVSVRTGRGTDRVATAVWEAFWVQCWV